jgi:hypothetical protein
VATTDMQIGQATLGIPLPIAYGPMPVVGNLCLLHTLSDATRIAFIGLGEGEWDGIDRLWINRKLIDHTDNTVVHFHPGIEGTLGAGLAATSLGGDQGVDQFFTLLPPGIQPLTFSGKAYIALKIAPDAAAPGPDFGFFGHFRTLKCRIFDAAGNQTGYAYTTNPAWQILDLIIRIHLKREGLKNEALTANEKARIDFASFADAATWYDFNIGGGIKRIECGVAEPNLVSMQQLLDQMLRMSQSYSLESQGKIMLLNDKARASTFTIKSTMIVPGSANFDKRYLRGAKNRYVAKFADLNPPVIATIAAAPTGAVRSSNVVTITTTAAHGLQIGDNAFHSGIADNSFNVVGTITAVPSSTTYQFSQVGANATSGGGTVGLLEQKFFQPSPVFDHEQHQFAIGQRGAGLSSSPKRNIDTIDLGINTGERVSRLVNFLQQRNLGLKVDPYLAPWDAEVKVWWEAVDAGGNALMAQLPGDIATVDQSVSEENQGDYEIIEILKDEIERSSDSRQSGRIATLRLKETINAYSDAADGQPALTTTRPGSPLTPVPVNVTYRPLSNPLSATDAGSSDTLVISGFTMRVSGKDVPIFNGQITALARKTIYYIFYDDWFIKGGQVQFQATTTKEVAIQKLGRFFVGSILTPPAGGTDTVGNNDGGSGAQDGRLYVISPSFRVDPSFGANKIFALDAQIADGDTSTASVYFCPANGSTLFIGYIGGFPSVNYSWKSLSLKIKTSAVTGLFTGGGAGPSICRARYSLDYGASWTTIYDLTAANQNRALTVDTIALSVNQNVSLILVDIAVDCGSAGWSATINGYEVWVEGQI